MQGCDLLLFGWTTKGFKSVSFPQKENYIGRWAISTFGVQNYDTWDKLATTIARDKKLHRIRTRNGVVSEMIVGHGVHVASHF